VNYKHLITKTKNEERKPCDFFLIYQAIFFLFEEIKERGTGYILQKKKIIKLRSVEAKQITEKIIDMLGVVRIIARLKGDKLIVDKVKQVGGDSFFMWSERKM
jgi:hypothetical protein